MSNPKGQDPESAGQLARVILEVLPPKFRTKTFYTSDALRATRFIPLLAGHVSCDRFLHATLTEVSAADVGL